MNELLDENDLNGYGVTINRFNVGLISFCDDLIILSPYASHVNNILKLCEIYSKNWKLVLNLNKCYWFVHVV